MNTSFFRRQSTWVCILLAGLIVIAAYASHPKHQFKAENYLPLLKYAAKADTDTDTSTLVLTGFNFGFETISNPGGLPAGWLRWGFPSYDFKVDSVVKHSGKYSLRIESNTDKYAENEFGCPHLAIPVNFTGKTATVKAFMKMEGVEHPIGLMLRIDDSNGKVVAFDNMQQKGITGTQDWQEYSVTVPLPKGAKTIHIGAIHKGKGKLWIDDFQVSIGRKDVPEDYNLGLEKAPPHATLPDGWFKWGHPSYDIQLDSEVKHSGKYALRVEPKSDASTKEFGCPARSIPAIYEGQQITVKAFMRTEGVDQPIGLMLRIDGKSGGLQFDNMQQRGITGSGNWQEYSVTLPLPDNAETIFIGAILSGKGKLWVDDFQVLIDDQDISKAKLKVKKPHKAETDTEFENGSKITIKNYTPQTVANLELLGRIWGFLKYYHPAVATGDYDWDAELFRVMPSIIKAKDTGERNEIFVQWIDRLGKVKPAKAKAKDTLVVKLQPDLAWIEKPELGKSLLQKLKEIKNAERDTEHYYVGLYPSVGNPDFKNEKPYSQMEYYDDSGMRLLALFRYWNMIEYFYPYRHLMDKDWNTVLGEFIPKFLDGFTVLDYTQTLLQLIAHVNDTHANIWSNMTLDKWKGANIAPYDISFIEGKAVVTGVSNKDLVQSPELKKGDIITTVNQQPVEKFVEERKPYTPASNAPTQLRNIARELLRTNAEKITLQIIRNGKLQTCEVECFPLEKMYTRGAAKASHRLLSPDIGYIWPETLKNDSLPVIMEKFKNTKGIVIDFRCYPRTDFTVFTLGAYLSPQPTGFVKFTNGNIGQPGKFTYTKTLKVGEDNNPYDYKGKVVIIVNDQTQSSAEYHSMAFQTAPQAKVIGSVTAAADGNVSSIVLPGDVKTMITGIGVYYPDGRETQRAGITLDLEVKPTIKGVKEGRDELLEKAIEIINGNQK